MTAADVIAGNARYSIACSDALEWLRSLPDECVNTCVTSPPYYGLRDYGTGSWEGGEVDCDHSIGGQVQDSKNPGAITGGVRPGVDSSKCRKCGAVRIDKQIGLEETPEAYVAKLVAVFREVRRVLKDDATLWMNLGDSYNAYNGNRGRSTSFQASTEEANPTLLKGHGLSAKGLKQKDLIGIPWMAAFALRADGWYLRQDIIWAKPSPMPESVTDRCTKAHEYLFLLSKSPRYYFDQSAIAEPCTESNDARPRMGQGENTQYAQKRSGNKERKPATARDCPNEGVAGSVPWEGSTRNKRSVWTVAARPFAEAHFAVFPPKLIEPCIRASCPDDGIVMDVFTGSGTTPMVALEHGRRFIGSELNPEYVALAERRLERVTPAMFAM